MLSTSSDVASASAPATVSAATPTAAELTSSDIGFCPGRDTGFGRGFGFGGVNVIECSRFGGDGNGDGNVPVEGGDNVNERAGCPTGRSACCFYATRVQTVGSFCTCSPRVCLLGCRAIVGRSRTCRSGINWGMPLTHTCWEPMTLVLKSPLQRKGLEMAAATAGRKKSRKRTAKKKAPRRSGASGRGY